MTESTEFLKTQKFRLECYKKYKAKFSNFWEIFPVLSYISHYQYFFSKPRMFFYKSHTFNSFCVFTIIISKLYGNVLYIHVIIMNQKSIETHKGVSFRTCSLSNYITYIVWRVIAKDGHNLFYPTKKTKIYNVSP